MVVEDGTGLANANSYASEATLDTYTDDRGITLASGDAEAALVRATAAWMRSIAPGSPATKPVAAAKPSNGRAPRPMTANSTPSPIT
jgi:hypothetical protein